MKPRRSLDEFCTIKLIVFESLDEASIKPRWSLDEFCIIKHIVSNRFWVHRGFGDSGLYNTKRRVWRKPRRGSPPFTQNFNPGPVPKSPCVCCMCVLCCQQTLFEGCYLLESSAPICTSKVRPLKKKCCLCKAHTYKQETCRPSYIESLR